MLGPVRLISRALPPVALAAGLALGACDEQPATAPGVTADTATGADIADAAGDTAQPADTAEADTNVPADTSVPTDTSVPADTTEADTHTPADTSPADTAEADTTTGDTTTPTDTGEIVLPTVRPPVVATHSTFAGDWVMQPGKETTKCVVKRLDNATALWVSQIRTKLNPGSHHLIVYKSSETVEKPEPFNCDPFVETLKGETYPLMITQIREETLAFPNGVAFKFEPYQMVRLEAHYLNYFPNDITAHAEVHFDGIAEDEVVSEANMLFYGNPDLEIPAKSKYTTPKRFLSVLPGTRVFALTGHTHAYGTNVEIQMASSVDDAGMSVYPPEGEEFTWDEPPVTTFDPPLLFGENQGFNYTCSWNNTSDGALGFGESANQEMCFFWAYYYPSQGYRLCVSPGNIGEGVAGDEVCCPGHWVCDYIRQFL